MPSRRKAAFFYFSRMFKKLDIYIIKTFFAPFALIFSVVFFIFMVNIIWLQLNQFIGKGLTYFEILKFLFYLSVSVVNMVLPLTILLASIMTFGELGERYELAAMKASGISLTRIMAPLFVVAMLFSGILFLFSNYTVQDFQRKAKNMLYNIRLARPALSFEPGQFIDQIPQYMVKFDRISGENDENLEGIFVRKKAESYENQQSIVAKRGKFVPAEQRQFLKLILFNGYIFEEDVTADPNKRANQPDRAIRFDSLTTYFDISAVINNQLEQEKITDDYRFKNYSELNQAIEENRQQNGKIFTTMNTDLVNQTNSYVQLQAAPSYRPSAGKVAIPVKNAKKEQQESAVVAAYDKLEQLKSSVSARAEELNPVIKEYSLIVMYQQRILAYPATCVIFFLIGSSLGSIIRKGGMGLPVVIAILIFIAFYLLNLSVENVAWAGKLNPYLAAWLPNLVMFPFGLWLTYGALTDSRLFDIEKYKALLKPLTKLLRRQQEHRRYQ